MQGDIAVTLSPDARVDPIDAETLFRAHAPFVASFLRHMGTPESDLDDHVQDIFVLAHRKGGYLPGPAAPRTWLASLALRVVLARRRSRARRPEAPGSHEQLLDHEAQKAPSPAEVLDTQRSLKRVQAALEHLSLEHRAAFILHEIDGESCESIAAIWQVPVGTVYSRLHHARKRFLEVYERKTTRAATSRKGTP